MPGVLAPGRGGFAFAISPSDLPEELAEDGFWYIDHLRHDDLSVYQTLGPENLHFILNIRDKDTVDYEISLSGTLLGDGGPIVSGNDFIHPWGTGWQLRYGSIVVSAGFHSEVHGIEGDDYMQVAGVSWLGYLDRCIFPYNASTRDTVFDYVIDDPPQGLAYQAVNVDASVIIKKLWDVIFAQANRPPLTYNPEPTGVNIPYYRLDLGDTSTFLSIIQSLAETSPGFDFWVDPVTLEFKTAGPYRFGTPAGLVSDGPTGPNIQYNTDDSDSLIVEFTNSGPEQTHLLATGSAYSIPKSRALGTILAEAAFWRLDGTYDAGDVYSQDQLNDIAGQQLSYGLNPVHTIPVTVDPKQITDFWTKILPGRAIWVNEDLLFHQINSPQRIVSMESTSDNEGNFLVALNLNEVYATDDGAGVVEG